MTTCIEINHPLSVRHHFIITTGELQYEARYQHFISY